MRENLFGSMNGMSRFKNARSFSFSVAIIFSSGNDPSSHFRWVVATGYNNPLRKMAVALSLRQKPARLAWFLASLNRQMALCIRASS
jgi:hypothetical protein